MKRLAMSVCAGLFVTAMAAPSFAADLRPSYKAPLYSAPAFSWTGFYVGINGGYGFGNSHWDTPVGVAPNPRGAVVGGTVGYNLQTGVWVWGVEGDLDYSAIKGTETCVLGTCQTSNNYLGTARLRLGYAGWDRWLPYITGGGAVGDIKAETALGSAKKTKFGYVFGGGVEYAFLSNWSVKAEYLYASLGSFDCGAVCGAATDEVSFKSSVVRAGLNYRF